MPAPKPEASVACGPPIAAFAAVMGIGGLGLAWRAAAQALPEAVPVGEALLAAAGLLGLALACSHAVVDAYPEPIFADVERLGVASE